MEAQCLAFDITSYPGGVVADVRLKGKGKLNLVDLPALCGMKQELEERVLGLDGLRCVVLRGADERAFIGGADLHALRALNAGTAEPFIRGIHDLSRCLREAQVPVIAVMRGYCLGAGLEIAAACDIRIADHSVRCGMPEVRIGVPSVVEAALLPGLIGWGKARELMLRGHIVAGEEAARMGLVDHLVAPEEREALAAQIVADILAGQPGALAAQKALFSAWENAGVDEAIELGVAAFVRAYESDEPQRAIEKFFENRDKR